MQGGACCNPIIFPSPFFVCRTQAQFQLTLLLTKLSLCCSYCSLQPVCVAQGDMGLEVVIAADPNGDAATCQACHLCVTAPITQVEQVIPVQPAAPFPLRKASTHVTLSWSRAISGHCMGIFWRSLFS